MFIEQGDTDSEEPSLYQTIQTYEAPWHVLHQMRDEIGAGNYNIGLQDHLDPTAHTGLNNYPAISNPTPKYYFGMGSEDEHSQSNFLPSNPV